MTEINGHKEQQQPPIVVAAVECGGTSFVVAVAELVPSSPSSQPKFLFRAVFDSSHDQPHQTLGECASFFKQHQPSGGYHALGIASFGPVGLDPQNKSSYGTILSTTPKVAWRNIDLLTPLVDACQGNNSHRSLVVKIDTDVNAPAVAEYLQLCSKNNDEGSTTTRTAKSITSLAYVTVGTGVGVGLVVHGQPVHGRMHPEGGHVPIQPLGGDTFPGYSWGAKSPFRGVHTVESMTSSVALTERLEQMTQSTMTHRDCLADLPDDHVVWDHAANAIANLCVTLILTTSIERIVLGGGVMKRNGLIEKVRNQTVTLLNGYIDLPEDMSELITKSSYGSDVGLIGAMVLAQRALDKKSDEEEESKKILSSKAVIEAKKAAFISGLSHGIVLGLALVYIGFMASTKSRPSRR